MASINGRIPILASIDGIMYGAYPDGSFVPPPTPEEVATEAVELAEYTTEQADVSTAQSLVTALDASATKTALQIRIDAIIVMPRFILEGSLPVGSVTPYISRQRLRVRAPGGNSVYKVDSTITQGQGWSTIHCEGKTIPTFRSFWGVGVEADILSAQDQGGGGLDTVLIGQSAYYNGASVSANGRDYVVAVNYQTNPHVYVIDVDLNTVVFDQLLSITTPVSFVAKTENDTDQERDWYFKLNTGGDVNNRPFPVDVDTLLTNAGADTTGLVLGWGIEGNRPTPAGSTSLNITTTPPVSPAVGVEIILDAVCTDADGVDRTSDIQWFNDFINWTDSGVATPTGGQLTFTPEVEGYYRIRATYEDTYGGVFTDTVNILVDGTLTHVGNTVFDAAKTHPDIADITDNNVRFETSDPFKLSTGANHANWGTFRYFEITAVAGDGEFGCGLSSVLNMLPLATTSRMWSGATAGTIADNAGGFSFIPAVNPGDFLGQQWVNGSNLTPTGNAFFLPNNNTAFHSGGGTLGVCVDTTDKTAPPIVYIIDADLAAPAVPRITRVFNLWCARTPLVPMIYCNSPSSNIGAGTDVSINGGGNGAFVYDPRPALIALIGPIPSFEYGWTTSEIQA